MTVAVFQPSFPRFRVAARRFALALAASAFAHLFLVQALILDAPQRVRQPAGAATIAVRLESPGGAVPIGPATPVSEPPQVARPVGLRAAAGDGSRHVAPAGKGAQPVQDAVVPLALPRTPDPTYYAARDLDVYPRPIVPLELDRLSRGVAGEAANNFRLALLIDEGGVVKEISVIEAGPPGRLQEALRSALAATRFFPGQKDGRAVKSRVLLSVSFDSARAENAGR